MFFDIHSHILPNVDDGAKDLTEALVLLKMMKRSGISAVIATSHFYPQQMNYEDYLEITGKAYDELLNACEGKKLPKIFYGCEMLYYRGIGNSEVLENVCLNRSKYLLLELAIGDINDGLFEDIMNLKQNGIIPVIAHCERYYTDKGFKRLFEFVKENDIPVQLNTASFFTKQLKKPVKAFLESGVFCVLGTDTHSVNSRPPLMKEALRFIGEKYGKTVRARLIKNGAKLYTEITGEKLEK